MRISEITTMQEGQWGGLDPLTIRLNQGSFQNNTSMDRSDSWDNRLDPVDNGLSSYILAPGDESISCMSSAGDRGESSSSGHNLQEQTCNYDSKSRLSWLNDTMSEDRSLEPSNMQNYSLNHGLLNLSSNNGHTLYKPDHSGKEHMSNFYVSSTNVGSFSGNSSTFTEINDASGPSCKTKSLEGTSGPFYHGGSSNSNQPRENITFISTGTKNLSPTNHFEQLSRRNGVGTSRGSPVISPSLSVLGIAEISARNFALRSYLGQHESVPFDMRTSTSIGHSSVNAVSNTNALELMSPMAMSMNSNNTLNQPLIREATETHSYPWNGLFSSRASERGSEAHEEANTRSSIRNNPEYPVTAPETRNILQEQIDWSFTPASSRNYYSSSEIGSSSRGQSSSTTWSPCRNQTSRNHQRLSEAAPWFSFPRTESDSRIRRSPFVPFSLTSSSSDETATTSNGQHQPDQRSAAFSMDMPGDYIHGWNALAAVEGRHRLICRVLNAVRRGDHLRAEDYMLIEPLVDAFAELHDQHRDLRFDIDNMSYEELLALEERIGNVSTGLSEEKIRGAMKQRKHETAVGIAPNLEPCCICQEDYVTGDDIGKLDCGHEFHTFCVEEWLKLKNMCPICKMMALGT